MTRFLAFAVGMVAAVATFGPAFADEGLPPPKKRAAPAAPVRVAPARVAPAPRPAPVQQASNWTGGQVGGSNGGSFANNAFADPGSFICPSSVPLGSGCFETPFNFTGHSASYTIGPFLGYRVQLGTFVVGIEGDASYKNTSNSQAQNSTAFIDSSCCSRTDSFYGSIKQGWDSSVRGRIGYLVTPWTLIYGTGGVAFERVSGSLSYTGNLYDSSCRSCTSLIGYATTAGSFSETRVGYTVGGGVEFQLGGPWSARIEYRYSDFGSFTKSVPVSTVCVVSSNCASSVSSGATIDLHPTFQTVRVGLGFGF